MDRAFQALKPFIRMVVRQAGWVLVIALLLSALGVNFARQLRIDTDLANLMPSSYPSVQALEQLRQTVGGESEVAVAIESGSFEANKAFAEALIPRALALTGNGHDEPYFTRVDYRKDVTFLEDNALYFATTEELDRLETYLDDKIEAAKLEANPFYFDLDDDEEEADTTAAALQQMYDDIVSKAYPISDDSLTMALQFYPTGAQTNIGFIEDAYADLDSLIASLSPASFDPSMEITLAGRLLRQLTEVRAIRRDVLGSFGVGVATVLLMVVLYFFYKGYRARSGPTFSTRTLLAQLARMPVLMLLIGLPLLMSLSWTFGIAYLAFSELNLMTSTLGLVLFGLGIDYGIHFYARYTEERGRGQSVVEAVETTFSSTGQAIAVGAMTTAIALYVLVIADFKGFSEFGFISGTGILFALIAMLVVMPALITVLERFNLLNLSRRDGALAPVDKPVRSRRFPGARGIVIGSMVAVLAALVMVPRVQFEYEFGRLEPVYEDYNAKREVVRRVYSNRSRRNPAYIVLDTPEEVQPVIEAIRAHAAQDTLSPTIRNVESLQDRFPMDDARQQAKLARIAALREALNDDFLQAEASEDLDKLRRAAQTTAPISMDQVPEFMRERFTSRDGEIGNFVIIYPSVGLSDGRQSMAFSDDVGTVVTAEGRMYHAGSTSLVGADMLRLMQREAPWMILATFVIVALLMWANFGELRWAALALLPLIVGVLWMLLLMEVFGIKLNFYNLIVMPAVLGIGNDAGVHLVHRYREEGRGSIRFVIGSTGEHVAMGSLTTMVGFAGLLLSFHPGLYSIGVLAVVGIGATLLAALIFLPALIQWREDRSAGPFDQPADVAPETAPLQA